MGAAPPKAEAPEAGGEAAAAAPDLHGDLPVPQPLPAAAGAAPKAAILFLHDAFGFGSQATQERCKQVRLRLMAVTARRAGS